MGDVLAQQFSTLQVIEVDHLYSVTPQQVMGAREVPRLADDNTWDSELNDRSSTHVTGHQRRVHGGTGIIVMPRTFSKAIDLGMQDGVVLLNPTVVPHAHGLSTAANEHRAG